MRGCVTRLLLLLLRFSLVLPLNDCLISTLSLLPGECSNKGLLATLLLLALPFLLLFNIDLFLPLSNLSSVTKSSTKTLLALALAEPLFLFLADFFGVPENFFFIPCSTCSTMRLFPPPRAPTSKTELFSASTRVLSSRRFTSKRCLSMPTRALVSGKYGWDSCIRNARYI